MVKQLTLTQRRSIVENLWENGIHDVSQPHKITHLPISTLYKYIKKLSVAASLKPKSRPGRPKKLTAEERIHLGKLANLRKCAIAVKKLLMCLTKPTQALILHQEQSVRIFITSVIAFVYQFQYQC